MIRPPMELMAAAESLDGSSRRFDPNAPSGEDRPTAMQFSTRLMEGFANGSAQFVRRGSLAQPDLAEYATFRMFGIDGDLAYEGRIGPSDDERGENVEALGVNIGSWMNHARDKPLAPYIYLDRSIDRWGDPPAERTEHLKANNRTTKGPEKGANGETAFRLLTDGLPFNAGSLPNPCAYYEAPPGASIGWLRTTLERTSTDFNTADANWHVYHLLAYADDPGSSTHSVLSGDYRANVGTAYTPKLESSEADLHWAAVDVYYGTAIGGADNIERGITVSNPVVAGPHNLPLDSDDYLRASDIIKHSASLVAPLLDTRSIENSLSYNVGHLVIDEPTDAYDIWLLLNRYDIRNLAVWENRRLTNERIPSAQAATANWRVRGTDKGVTIKREARGQGINGVRVRFENISTGRQEIRTPDDDARLADSSPALAPNQAGVEVWKTITMPSATTPELAISHAARALELYNQQQQPCRVIITGYVNASSGALAQAWKVRAGQFMLVEDDPGLPLPRLVVETVYDARTFTLTASLDATSQELDALVVQAIQGA